MDIDNLVRIFAEGPQKYATASSLTLRLSSLTTAPQWELVSYDTVIARRWHRDDGVVIFWLSTKKFTRTTSAQQKKALSAVTKYREIVSGVLLAQGESDPMTLANAEVMADHHQETGKASTLEFKRPNIELMFRALKVLREFEVTASMDYSMHREEQLAVRAAEARAVLKEVEL